MIDDTIFSLIPDIEYFVHRKCTPSWIIDERRIDTNEIIYVIKGEAEYIIENKTYHVKQGDVLCIPKNTLHSAKTLPENLMECFSVSFYLYDKFGAEGIPPLPLISQIDIQPDLISWYGDLNSSWLLKRRGYKAKCTAFFIIILLRYYELILYKDDYISIDPRIDKIVRFITDNYAVDITVDSASKITGLHPNYFGALFKTSTGLPFRQFLTSVRINKAENLLKDGQYNVSEVAELCGFTDACYFSRIYKKSRGIPPSKVVR